jgi:hypothetical protein
MVTPPKHPRQDSDGTIVGRNWYIQEKDHRGNETIWSTGVLDSHILHFDWFVKMYRTDEDKGVYSTCMWIH